MNFTFLPFLYNLLKKRLLLSPLELDFHFTNSFFFSPSLRTVFSYSFLQRAPAREGEEEEEISREKHCETVKVKPWMRKATRKAQILRPFLKSRSIWYYFLSCLSLFVGFFVWDCRSFEVFHFNCKCGRVLTHLRSDFLNFRI